MKISPEPLHPLRNWRELWYVDTSPFQPAIRERVAFPEASWKQQKRPAFHWLTQLLNHESEQ